MENDNQWCFAWTPVLPSQEKTRAALVKDAKWASASKITISFLDGDESIKDRVRKVAKEWVGPGMANLTLDFQNGGNTHIRISFKNSGSWSLIGTWCKHEKVKPTMNFGWLTPATKDEELRRVVLHEFGHALGLVHEHQNPGGTIPWNKSAVYKDLSGPPNNWDRQTIDTNMFTVRDRKETNFTLVDAKSIMMYPIPKSWTDGTFSVGLNSELSDIDKQFIRQQYP